MSSAMGSIFFEKSIIAPLVTESIHQPAFLPLMILSISRRFPWLYTLQPRQSRSTLLSKPSLSQRKSVAREISKREQISFVLYFLEPLRVTIIPSLLTSLIICIVSIVMMILKKILLSSFFYFF